MTDNTTTRPQMWSLELPTGSPLTYCEACALAASNEAVLGLGELPYTSMLEFVTISNALLAAAGQPQLEIASHHAGRCEQCGLEQS